MVEPKHICSVLINLPEDDRDWIVAHIPPSVFVCWVVQIQEKTLDRKDLQKRIEDYRSGVVPLPDWEKI